MKLLVNFPFSPLDGLVAYLGLDVSKQVLCILLWLDVVYQILVVRLNAYELM